MCCVVKFPWCGARDEACCERAECLSCCRRIGSGSLDGGAFCGFYSERGDFEGWFWFCYRIVDGFVRVNKEFVF